MQIVTVSGKSGYIKRGGALMGTFSLSERELVLIDSGERPDEEFAAFFKDNGLSVRAVLCTHLHPDHVANNYALYEKYGCEIFLPQERFLFKEERTYPYKTITAHSINICGAEIAVIKTPGHSPGHVAYVTPDGVCCVGDALISQPLLGFSKMPYLEDVEQAILSMEKLRTLPYEHYIIAHRAQVTKKELDALIEANIQKELELYDRLRRYIAEPMDMEQAVSGFMAELGISPKMQASRPMRETVKARIRTLAEAGELCIEDGRITPANG